MGRQGNPLPNEAVRVCPVNRGDDDRDAHATISQADILDLEARRFAPSITERSVSAKGYSGEVLLVSRL
jgi:hypothetical protein